MLTALRNKPFSLFGVRLWRVWGLVWQYLATIFRDIKEHIGAASAPFCDSMVRAPEIERQGQLVGAGFRFSSPLAVS